MSWQNIGRSTRSWTHKQSWYGEGGGNSEIRIPLDMGQGIDTLRGFEVHCLSDRSAPEVRGPQQCGLNHVGLMINEARGRHIGRRLGTSSL